MPIEQETEKRGARGGWSIIAFSAGAFAALSLVWISPTAALLALAMGAFTAVILANEKQGS